MATPHIPPLSKRLPAMDVMGVPISVVNMDRAVGTIVDRVHAKEAQFVCVRDVHGVIGCQDDPNLMSFHRQAGLVVPDGAPLVWLSRRFGVKGMSRVCGYDLVDALCAVSGKEGIRHFLYGGKPGVAETMAGKLREKYPDLEIVGVYSPPFGGLAEGVDQSAVDMITKTGANVVWIGLSTPKQEYWMANHVAALNGATLIGIGAAFDFHAGAVKRAPPWMRDNGLEWAHRLMSEPRRLWKRYLLMAPRFAWQMLPQIIRGRQDLAVGEVRA